MVLQQQLWTDKDSKVLRYFSDKFIINELALYSNFWLICLSDQIGICIFRAQNSQFIVNIC